MTKKKSESSLIKVHSRFKMHDNAHFTPLISEFELMTLMYKEDTDLSFITKLLTSNYSIVDIPLTSYVPIIDSSELSQVAGNLGQFEFLPTQGISQKYSRSKIIDLNKLREYAKQEIIILKQKEYIQKIRDAQAKTRRTPTQDKTIRVLDTMRSDPSESKDDRIPSFKEFTRFIKGLSDTRDGLTKNLLVSPNKTERRYLSPQPLKFSKNVNNSPMSFEQLKIFVEHNIKKFRVKGTMLQFPINEERAGKV
ncbi:unnamed protein product [Moneuplotes crassus]|uniref:Uncharacterized protein n=1 Tax=Euplotes crassus TaxID=5936 RepID=A0AAD1U8G9_EUPCR|nr:unnamed protein product [Moneuplotes crassus]